MPLAAVTLDHGATVITESRALRETSRLLRKTWMAYRGPRPLRGASNSDPAADVTATIRGVSLGLRCVASKAGLSVARLDDVMLSLQRTVAVGLSLAPCDGCQRDTLLYRIG